jgi:hypothetical protein
LAIRCAAMATFTHGGNIAAFTFDGGSERPAKPTRTMLLVADVIRASLIASCMLE